MKRIITNIALHLLLSATYTPVLAQQQQFTTSGSFTTPEGVLSVKVECIGAGGAGGRVTSSNIFDKDAAGGGGGGAYASGIVHLSAGDQYPVIVGKGGKNEGSAIDGENSLFDTGAIVNAAGGKTRGGNDEEAGAEGGKAAHSIGQITYDGGNGGRGVENDADGGGGGGAAGSLGRGIDGATVNGGGNRADYGGYGGNGGADGAVGSAGGNYGGGGGGSSANGGSTRNGGKGADGLVVITWSSLHDFNPKTLCGHGTVTLQGNNLNATDSVSVNGQNVPFTVLSNNELSLTIDATNSTGAIIVYTQNGACTISEELKIIGGTVQVTTTNNQLSGNFSGGGSISYQWYNCVTNTPVSNATQASYSPEANGIYSVKITTEGCEFSSGCTPYTLLKADQITAETVSIYPNPAYDLLTIRSSTPIRAFSIKDINGKSCHEGSLHTDNAQINIGLLPQGCYFIEVLHENNTTITQLILKQ